MNNQWPTYIRILKELVKPALGCTEPISAAYASACASALLGSKPTSLDVFVSDNLYKNSMGVFVPGTGKVGLAIAAATGSIGGDVDSGLEVLADITQEQVQEAQLIIDEGKVTVSREKTDEFIYCRVVAKNAEKEAEIIISGGHTRVVYQSLNGQVLFQAGNEAACSSSGSHIDNLDISIQAIYDFATQVQIDDIAFILEARDLNMALAKDGLCNEYGLQIGRTISSNVEKKILGAGIDTSVVMFTAAASDARMGGATLPAMSNYGSGNQGIAATIPVVKAAEFVDADEEKLTRALIMSHLSAVYIKSHYPPLSAFCGNAVTSSAAAMAMVYLAGGTYEQSCAAIMNTISDTSGMICDGAKSTCAMKVGSSSQSAVKSVLLALNDKSVVNQGIVASEVEKTIRNVGKMVTNGMPNTDAQIIDIMSA